ncbi:MAG: ABC transporter permease [Candidatus Izemoplasmatales bacterium]
MIDFKFWKKSSKTDKKDNKDKEYAFLSAVISIVVGLLVAIMLLFLLELVAPNSDFSKPILGIKKYFTYSFTSTSTFFKIFYNAAPLMLTGLAVGFAFKAGLFNIGATGQYAFGAFFALVAAILWQFPWWAALLVSIVAGAIWGVIPGLFKAFFNINEVITSIMLNWAGLYLANLLFYNLPAMHTVLPNRTDNLAFANPSAILPNFGLNQLLNTSYINIGIIIAIVVAVIIYIVLEKTVFGYEIKACGANRNASLFAGIKTKSTIIFTMLISGGLAGLAGGIVYLAGTVEFTVESHLLAMGFNGIPVALLAYSQPLAIIATSIFIGFLESSGSGLQGLYSYEMTSVILSVIIYFSAFALIVGHFIKKILKRRKNSKNDQDNETSSDLGIVPEAKPRDDEQIDQKEVVE